MQTNSTTLLMIAALAAPAAAQVFPTTPGPDLLITDGRLDGIRRLTDTDGDGTYSIANGEVYDYVTTTGVDTTFRQVVYLNGYLYTTCSKTDKLWRGADQNGDGVIDMASEFEVAMDPAVEMAPFVPTATFDITTDGVNLWISNNSGDSEGLWRLTDHNGDGLFTSAQLEIWPAFVEANSYIPAGAEQGVASVPLGNAPNTTGAFVEPTSLQSISFDPTVSAGSVALGRLILEDEANNNECLIAFEDKNGDGDFYDVDPVTGPEVYLFLCLTPSRGLSLDVSAEFGNLPAQYQHDWYELEHVVVDATGAQRIYYISSESDDTGSTDEDSVLFRGVDLNNDGDINDAGELNVFFDGSINSLGPFTEYQQITGIGLAAGDPVLCLEHFNTVTGRDVDHVVMLRDLDMSGSIDLSFELAVVAELTEVTLYNVAFFPNGFFSALPAGNVGYYQTRDLASCQSTAATTHTLDVGTTNWDDKIVAGQTVSFVTEGAAANAPAAFHIGVPFSPAPIPLDALGACELAINPVLSVAGLTTDAAGSMTLSLTIPASLSGQQLAFETVALDVGASLFNATASNSLLVQFGDYALTMNSRVQ